MAARILLKGSSVALKVPLASDLQGTEVAINTADRKLYCLQGGSVVIVGVSSVAGKQGDVTLEVTDVSGAAPLNSPTFTGNPKSVTPPALDSSTSIATTEWVQALFTGDLDMGVI